ncbi:MAG TPA: hypothetical protein VGS19_20840 [Streptosporangiaceae bacterium]|nr:hypothetical protein [Streptosporangiaceae bacterium]
MTRLGPGMEHRYGPFGGHSPFWSALIHQGILVVVIFIELAVVLAILRGLLTVQRNPDPGHAGVQVEAEPVARRVVRIGFGVLWLFDAVLQVQSGMVSGLPSQVIIPAAATSPRWVRHLVDLGAQVWVTHPVQMALAVVWVQSGIGLWMLTAPHGRWSRCAGMASVSWGLTVWVFGEAFGGVFAPGLSWMSGAPGAVAFYCAGGLLVALPERAWSRPRLGRVVLAAMGAFFMGMAVVQALPYDGLWHGRQHGAPGVVAGMAEQMARYRQPGFLAGWVSAFASFDMAHGFAVNLFMVVTLAGAGAILLGGWSRLLRPVVVVTLALCLADWLLVQDLGFLGGLGTDPNSMVPIALVIGSGCLATAHGRPPEPAAGSGQLTAGRAPPRTAVGRESAWGPVIRQWLAAVTLRTLVSAAAFGLILLGAGSIALAQT